MPAPLNKSLYLASRLAQSSYSHSIKRLLHRASRYEWDQRGPTIPMPKRINAGFRDPVRAFEFPEGSDQWWVGVGGGNKPGCETSALAPGCGAQFCLFKAKDNTLSNFTDAGALYTTNETFGLVDSNIVRVQPCRSQ